MTMPKNALASAPLRAAALLVLWLAMMEPISAAAIYVVNHGWHTGLVIRRGDIPDGLWPEQREAPPGEYLEVGWGERAFYQSQEPSLLMALRAALWPSPGVLHLVGFNGPVAQQFPNSEIITLEVDTEQMTRLVEYIVDSYARDSAGKIKRLGRGLYGDSRFFAARENFHLFRTCNVWAARALRQAGCPVGVGITANNVMSSARICAAQ